MNNWTLSGKLGKDAETRTLDSGKTVITFSLATDETRKGADNRAVHGFFEPSAGRRRRRVRH